MPSQSRLFDSVRGKRLYALWNQSTNSGVRPSFERYCSSFAIASARSRVSGSQPLVPRDYCCS